MVLPSRVLPLSLPEMSGVRVKCAAAWGLPHPVPGLSAAVACQVGAGGMRSWTKATKLKGCVHNTRSMFCRLGKGTQSPKLLAFVRRAESEILLSSLAALELSAAL